MGELSAQMVGPIERAWSADRITWLPELNPANASAVARSLLPGDVVLLKGSRAMALERLIDAAEELPPQLSHPQSLSPSAP